MCPWIGYWEGNRDLGTGNHSTNRGMALVAHGACAKYGLEGVPFGETASGSKYGISSVFSRKDGSAAYCPEGYRLTARANIHDQSLLGKRSGGMMEQKMWDRPP